MKTYKSGKVRLMTDVPPSVTITMPWSVAQVLLQAVGGTPAGDGTDDVYNVLDAALK